MRVVIYSQSLASDWNHGNAHFLRGIAREFIRRGWHVDVFEPENNWSIEHLRREQGAAAAEAYRVAYPELIGRTYSTQEDALADLAGADLVLVHEWNEPSLVAAIGEHHRRNDHYRLFFHDTHHRAVTSSSEIAALDLSGYDGVLAFGDSLRQCYRKLHPPVRCWTWHEAADTTVFHAAGDERRDGFVWIGNWGDGERSDTLQEFLFQPLATLRVRAEVYGVRYPPAAIQWLSTAGIHYRGWTSNHRAAELLRTALATAHVPRGPYVAALPGIPTIRVFEALASGTPLLSAPWQDCENLFRAGKDFLLARSGTEMQALLQRVLQSRDLQAELAGHGLETIRSRHTCAHRVTELFEIAHSL